MKASQQKMVFTVFDRSAVWCSITATHLTDELSSSSAYLPSQGVGLESRASAIRAAT